MTIHATIIDGKVIPDDPLTAENGTRVTLVIPAPPKPCPTGEGDSVGKRLLKFAGTAKGLPPDAALNHDHYLYGTSKK